MIKKLGVVSWLKSGLKNVQDEWEVCKLHGIVNGGCDALLMWHGRDVRSPPACQRIRLSSEGKLAPSLKSALAVQSLARVMETDLMLGALR